MKPVKWTIEIIKELSTTYHSPSEFKKANASAYKAMRRYGLVSQLYPLDKRQRKPKFTEHALMEIMQACSSRSDFQMKHPSAYNAARKLNLISKIFQKSRRYDLFGREPYSEEELINKCRSYSTITEFSNKDSGAYQTACRKGLLQKYGPPPISGYSIAEKEVLAYLQTLVPDFSPKRFANDYALDAYSPSLNLGVEYNGLWVHSEANKERLYHLKKTKYFEDKGIRIIHIWEHEWRDRRPQVENYLRSACRANSVRVGARKCEFKEIDRPTARAFLNETHIQGSTHNFQWALGCFYQGVLVAVSVFANHHRNRSPEKVLSRFSCLPGHTISGCLAKMSKIAYDKFGALLSWADYARSQGVGYLAAGWNKIKTHPPDYFYITSQAKVISKQSRKKANAKTPEGMTEGEHARKDGLLRVWDCGKILLRYQPS